MAGRGGEKEKSYTYTQDSTWSWSRSWLKTCWDEDANVVVPGPSPPHDNGEMGRGTGDGLGPTQLRSSSSKEDGRIFLESIFANILPPCLDDGDRCSVPLQKSFSPLANDPTMSGGNGGERSDKANTQRFEPKEQCTQNSR